MGAACEQTWKIFPSFEYFEHFSVVLLRQQNSGVNRSRVIFLFAIAEFLPAAFCSEFQTLAHLVTSEHGKLFHKKSLSLILNQSVSHPVARWTCPECGAGRGGIHQRGWGRDVFLGSPWCPSTVPTASWPGPGKAEHMAHIWWHAFSLAWENLCQTQKYSQQSDLFGYILWRSQIGQYFGRGKLNSWKCCKEREGASSTIPERSMGHKHLDREFGITA